MNDEAYSFSRGHFNKSLHVAGRRPLVLVVDDEELNREILYELLTDVHDVVTVTNGFEAISFCTGRQPDLILLDLNMPGLDGYQVCAELIAEPLTSEIPIIFVTGHHSPEDEAKGFRLGAVDFISKPFHPDIVKARVRTHLALKLQAEKLRSLALVDGLTGIANRREFDTRMEAEWRRCRRSKSSLSVVMIDIDLFKSYNDSYGHQAGDQCIKIIASILKAGIQRPGDIAARYGGEEFVCILPETSGHGAYLKAVELEAAVRGLGIPHRTSTVASIVTISVGVAAAIPSLDDDAASLIAEADRQLYLAKNLGRGQVSVTGRQPSPTDEGAER